MAGRLDGKVAIVTGGNSGIGEATAHLFAREGAKVALMARREQQGVRVQDAIRADGGDATYIQCDVTDRGMVDSAVEQTVAVYGGVDVLFNNAGMGAPGVPLEELTYEQWTAVVDVNLTGVFLCTQEAFKVMKAHDPMGGRIINNGSISAQTPRPNSVPYTAAKHAITGLTKCTSLDGRKYNIACGQIDIGNALTDRTAGMGDGVRQATGAIVPEPTFDVGHVANAVVHMASLPLDTNILAMTIMATKAPLVGRG